MGVLRLLASTQCSSRVHTTYTHTPSQGTAVAIPSAWDVLRTMIEKAVPGIYVNSIQIGDDFIEDTLNGFFKNANDQITEVCANLSVDPKLQNGFNAMGFSQGGTVLVSQGRGGGGGGGGKWDLFEACDMIYFIPSLRRALVQRCPKGEDVQPHLSRGAAPGGIWLPPLSW